MLEVTATQGKYNDRWVVFADWHGARRAVFESASAYVAFGWAARMEREMGLTTPE